MKIKNAISMIMVSLLSIFTMASCVKDTDYELPNLDEIKKQIPSFDGTLVGFEQVVASSTTTITDYVANHAIEGYVVSSDEGGNFYKKIYVQNADKTHGIALSINKAGLHTQFPVGAKIQIRLKDLSTQINNGGLEIGYGTFTSESGRVSMGSMSEAIYKKHIFMLNEPLKKLDELAKADASINVLRVNANVNQLITLKNVSFEASAIGKPYHQTKNDPQRGTNYNLIDANGKKIIFRTSSFANFRNKIVPAGILEVTGVLTKYGTTFQFMINDETNIKVVGSGSNNEEPQEPQVVELDATKATAADYADGKKVILTGKITIENRFSHIKLSDGTLIQLYAKKSDYDKLSKETKDKLRKQGQAISINGVFKDYNKSGQIIKQIVYTKESDLTFK